MEGVVNIEKIGRFDEEGNWNLTVEEQAHIRKIFQKLTSNKIAHKSAKKVKEEEYDFQPKICENSR